MRSGKFFFMGLLAVGSLLTTGSAFADSVQGMANIAGSVTVTKDTISFNHDFVTVPGSTNTGSFASLVNGTVNSDLTGGPTYGAVDYKDFITFNLNGGRKIDFDLTYIEKGNVDNSPFTFTQAGSNVVVGLSLDGVSYYEDSPNDITGMTSGVYSTQLVVHGESISDVIASVEAGNAIAGQSYSATFTASTPEPASWLLMSAGLLAAGLVGRRKLQSAKTNA